MRRFWVSWVFIVVAIILLEGIGIFFSFFQHPSIGYDKLLHFLAGIACGIFGAAIASSQVSQKAYCISAPYAERKRRNTLLWFSVMFCTIVIGGGWELFQTYFPAMRDASDYDLYDTAGDMIFDTLGGVVAGFIYQERREKG